MRTVVPVSVVALLAGCFMASMDLYGEIEDDGGWF